jgi:hypothetical protein
MSKKHFEAETFSIDLMLPKSTADREIDQFCRLKTYSLYVFNLRAADLINLSIGSRFRQIEIN